MDRIVELVVVAIASALCAICTFSIIEYGVNTLCIVGIAVALVISTVVVGVRTLELADWNEELDELAEAEG